jgi:DNA-directed RNA polymerase specialized sigma24 family protein
VNSQHRAIRALLQSMSPRRAVGYIQSFQLPDEEEQALIECDVRGKSCVQAADGLCTTPDTIKRRRQRAYRKMADAMIHDKSRGG